MSDTSLPLEFPPVDPTTFDLIIVGTGFPQSIIAAAASTAGKSVLHLDPNPFYGSHFSSVSPLQLFSILSPSPQQQQQQQQQASFASKEYDTISLSFKPLLTHAEISHFPSELDQCIPRFSFDVSGPRVLFCADSVIDLLVKSGVANYLEFKAVDSTLIYDGESRSFSTVPDSRRALFMDRTLKLTEKTELNKFFNLVKTHCSSTDAGILTEEDLESPFVVFLNNKRLSSKFQRIILYAIALADYDQENIRVCKDLLKTKDGIRRLALYHSSMERFPNAPGAMLYPMYGQGELPQAFCRRAAVKGCIHVLRMPVAALLADKESGLYRGVKLASGQDIFSQQLLLDPHYEVPRDLTSPILDDLSGSRQDSIPRKTTKVARGICITRKSFKSDANNLLIVYPPRSLYIDQATSVRALQLGSNSAVCPSGMFVLYFSTLCDDASEGKELLNAALNALYEQLVSVGSDNPDDDPVALSEVSEEEKPALAWKALYIQEMTEESVRTISTSPSPDGNIDYINLIDITEKMYQQMFPGEEFFPETASTEDPDNTEDYVPE